MIMIITEASWWLPMKTVPKHIPLLCCLTIELMSYLHPESRH